MLVNVGYRPRADDLAPRQVVGYLGYTAVRSMLLSSAARDDLCKQNLLLALPRRWGAAPTYLADDAVEVRLYTG